MTQRRLIIEDPHRPHLLRLGVAYRVVARDGVLLVRPAAQNKVARGGAVQPRNSAATQNVEVERPFARPGCPGAGFTQHSEHSKSQFDEKRWKA